MNQLDLFAGIGGISLAAEWAGIETAAFCEKEPFAQGVLRRRFPGRPIYDDVFNLTREVLERDGIITRERGIDIVAGGFPCQPFSHAGKRTGTADDRYLWPEMCRIVGEVRPTWVFAENVDGLVSMAQSDWESVVEDETTICEEAEMVLETIRKDLEAIGYRSIPVVIPACGVGASHRRYRIFILGFTASSGLSQRGCAGFAACEEEAAAGMESEPKRSSEALAQAEGERCRNGHDCSDKRQTDREINSSANSGSPSVKTLADSSGERCGEAREYCGRSAKWTPVGGALADTERIECIKRFEDDVQRGRSRETQQIRVGSCGIHVADSSGAGCQEFYSSSFPNEPGYRAGGGHSLRSDWTTQSGVGGSPYELSDWLDGYGMNPLDALINFISAFPQPALMGQGQHAWEPPRVANGVNNRVARLKALGNAVDPLQALPVLYGIRVIHEWLENEYRGENQ